VGGWVGGSRDRVVAANNATNRKKAGLGETETLEPWMRAAGRSDQGGGEKQAEEASNCPPRTHIPRLAVHAGKQAGTGRRTHFHLPKAAAAGPPLPRTHRRKESTVGKNALKSSQKPHISSAKPAGGRAGRWAGHQHLSRRPRAAPSSSSNSVIEALGAQMHGQPC